MMHTSSTKYKSTYNDTCMPCQQFQNIKLTVEFNKLPVISELLRVTFKNFQQT